jgi:PAS domain S-box-containing protein
MRILVVDDKEENRYYLEMLLTGYGHEVALARHGAEGLVMARQRPPDLVVSDLLMPVMDGYMLLRHWKGDPVLKRVPFVVYTATYTEPRDEQLALDLGADAFILKPAEPDDFLARLAAVMTRTATEAPREGGALDSDPALLELYSRSLIRKLEEKTLQLDDVNKALQNDIAERIRAEAELKRIAGELRQQAQLLDKAKDAILVRDLDHTVRYWNRSAERLYGWTAEEAVGRSIRDLIYSDITAFDAASAKALSEGEWSGEIDQRTKDGRPITVEGHWTLVRDDDGQPMSMFVINTDVTHRKALELQFLRAQRLESVGTMAGGIAHDLNNVLSPILMSIGLLKQSLQRPENIEILDLMENSALRGADMVAQVLSFARGTDGGRVRTSIAHAARDVARIASDTFPKNITLTTQVPPDLWTIEADPTQLHQVLLNLCVNARDAMPRGGQLVIRARNLEVTAARAATLLDVREGPYIVVEILDTGAGIAPDLMDKIFDPFFTTKAVGKGTGLGLSTSMSIVKRHGGSLDCESRLGHGTTFRLYLPARPDLAEGS